LQETEGVEEEFQPRCESRQKTFKPLFSLKGIFCFACSQAGLHLPEGVYGRKPAFHLADSARRLNDNIAH
jgi:hypothetical protein